MRSSLIESGTTGLAWRFLTSRKVRGLLTLLGVALGVALISALTVLGTTLQASINDQLREGFGTYDVMAGYHDQLMPPALQQRLAGVAGVRYSVGVLYLSPGRRETQGVPMKYNYIAIGEFPKGEFGYPLQAGHYPGPGEFVAEPRMATMLGLKVNDTVALPFKTGPQTVRLVGLTRTSGKDSSDSLLFNLTWLQEQMGVDGQTTLMLFGMAPGANKDVLGANLRNADPTLDIQLRKELDEVRRNMGGLLPMAVAFGLVGLFAAGFLVAGSFGMTVQERSRELALLRAVGADEGQVMRLVLREATLLGLLGGLGGAAVGVLGAWAALGATALSLGVRQHAPVLPWAVLLAETAGGAALAMLAAWRPARAAGRVPPLQAMRPDAATEARQEKAGGAAGLALLGLGALSVGAATFMKEGTGSRVLLGAVGGLLFTIGLILALPRVLPPMVHLLAWPLRLVAPGEAVMAGRSVLRHRKRAAITAATLVLGVMLTSSITTILGQLAANGERYTRSQFPSDATVSVSRPDQQHLGADLPAQLRQIPGVTAVAAAGADHWGYLDGYGLEARTELSLLPLDLAAMGRVFDYGTVHGDLTGPGAVLSMDQARRYGLAVGDTFGHRVIARLLDGHPEFSDPVIYTVVAIADRLPVRENQFAVSRSLFPDDQDTRVYFNYDLTRKAQVLEVVQALLQAPAYGEARLRDRSAELADLRQQVAQRMVILGAVALIILLMAAFGLFNALVTGLHQRRREIATVRAVGATPAQVTRQIIWEALLVGFTGTLLGLLAGAFFVEAVSVALGDGGISLQYGLGAAFTCLVAGPLLAVAAGIPPALHLNRVAVTHLLHAE